jgi:23S rRNA pseudouridine2457 synthase
VRPVLFAMRQHRYLLFNKPFHVLSQFTLGKDGPAIARPTLSQFIPVPDVYPVGRLDYDSEGLLLLTDDGPLQHRLSDPRFEHPRTYWAQVEGMITDEAAQRLAEGVLIQGRVTKPCEAKLISEPLLLPRDPPIRFRQNIPVSWVQLTLTEGRNRQARRMTAAVGFPTLRLVRFAIGDLTLDHLESAQWRDLTASEQARLRRPSHQKEKGRLL